MQIVRLLCTEYRARVALAAAAAREGSERASRLREVGRLAGALRKEKIGWADAAADLLEAGVAHVKGDVARAVEKLSDADRLYAGAEMALHTQVVRRQRGKLLGGDEGAALVAGADASMTRQGIVKPERFAALFAPGF
jgi:hypothetical protein